MRGQGQRKIETVLHVASPHVKCVMSCVTVIFLLPMLSIRNIRSILNLIVIPQMLCILCNVKSVVYSMWVALTRRLGLDLTTTRRAIVSLLVALREYPRMIFSGILQGRIVIGFSRIILIIDQLNGNGRRLESFWQYKLEIFAPRVRKHEDSAEDTL